MQTDLSMPHALKALLDMIDPGRMFADTQTLCQPALAGRRVGTEGHRQATDFLVAHFRGSGWHTTLEPFTITTSVQQRPVQPLAAWPKHRFAARKDPHNRGRVSSGSPRPDAVPARVHQPTGCATRLFN